MTELKELVEEVIEEHLQEEARLSQADQDLKSFSTLNEDYGKTVRGIKAILRNRYNRRAGVYEYRATIGHLNTSSI